MKQLIDIVKESIFDIDDETIATKNEDYNIVIDDSAIKLEKSYGITKDDFIYIINVIRENKLKVKGFTNAVADRLNKIFYKVFETPYTHNRFSSWSIFMYVIQQDGRIPSNAKLHMCCKDVGFERGRFIPVSHVMNYDNPTVKYLTNVGLKIQELKSEEKLNETLKRLFT